jgi:gas vesicle protein
MGFLAGIVTGVALAAAGAAWYMSRGGEKIREQYRFEEKLGELGDEIDTRTKDIQSTVQSQIAEIRSKAEGNGSGSVDEALDDVTAGAAEAAADVEAGIESTAGKAKKAAKDVADEATS